ncbi:ATP-grasp domain-containing protein [Neorhizobium galegae]|uniref:ATP-grasp domain-containing protein n=1 Tax=Neorhizobium galegae TaxID=399 RepID=UPI002107E4FF|nr:ATP-grasp domain-containing protein [Neorhizobium galegae]MCQ1769262.1 ATP-grasp domain-containing protein [Neorhizobium galegae]MCQ1848417.1 ATP-grasp domain-containing protein [Neorhizobium galegae]
MTTVLVTGVGAIIGYGILRSLRMARPDVKLVGIDIHSDAVGQRWADQFFQVPLTADPVYPEVLSRIITDAEVDLIIPGIEQDTHFFSDNRSFIEKMGVAICLNSRRLVDLSRDKWLMYQELQAVSPEINIPTYRSNDFDFLESTLGLPFIVKPRRSYASKGLVKVKDRAGFQSLAAAMGETLIAQPIIGTDDEEYTVAAFGDGEGAYLAHIVLQRRLAMDGSTAKAIVRADISLQETLRPIFAHFQPIGPTNLQFRRVNATWKLLEINPRVSSATSIRSAFGYNESEMALEFFLYGNPITQPEIRRGTASRYIEDSIVYDRDNF